ncbi:mechanosensitive ion channel family protein [Ruegeria pomeroyi]|nr:mechanosensitive ion channel family protein [Ruegeria pomeroyi]MCE8519558.1 mechanosensitive ion channel family protein [Ruegeria pomeroyi]MCE8528213.1 mechanosensitive ion channel family protein [Ruegeria pomeroyi]MCE8531958.1 mechanosensitive ion channel family protein [Ruegeria pomeroyi]MCE8545871.1 mechanosensitive ion channel family protein [Ruegeria pomeroyi]
MYRLLVIAVLVIQYLCTSLVSAQETSAPAQSSQGIFQAPVILDGSQLFLLRGVTGLPAERRALRVHERLVQVATASDSATVDIEKRKERFGYVIYADGVEILTVTQADASLEKIDIELLTDVQAKVINDAILTYRSERSDEARIEGAIYAMGWTLAFALFTFLGALLRRFLNTRITKLVHRNLAEVESATKAHVRADAIAALIRFGISFILLVIFFLGVYYYLSFVLLSFAETRYVAQLLLTYVTRPVLNIVLGFINYLPNLVTLLIIAAVTQYIIRGLRIFFEAVEAGSFEIGNFERHWVIPTFNLIRAALILIALVFSFPYIPGSESAAFQGLTILVGAMLSLGSNSVMNNLISGLFVIYRRSTSIGDRIQIGDHLGDVVEIKLMETHLRSTKNELISIPNAQLLNSEVVNYTKHSESSGVILHTTVGIGYEEPAEKVEAMLIEAARRTDGLRMRPEPFVLWTALADYAVNYEINAHTTRGSNIPRIKSELHRNIFDVFTENGVQIMTPSYEADPEVPKIPTEKWSGKLAHEASEADQA